ANTNVQFAEKVKREAGIVTRTVGLIAAPKQAEAIIAEGKADMVALARAMLDDPHWGWRAAHVLGAEVARPKQYQRAAPQVWAGVGSRGWVHARRNPPPWPQSSLPPCCLPPPAMPVGTQQSRPGSIRWRPRS